MRQRTSVGVTVVFFVLSGVPASAANILLRGKVLMQDGSAPGKSITIERVCYGRGTSRFVANTAKTGQYLYTADVDALTWDNCALRGVLRGYDSTVVRISHLNSWSDPNLPDIVLRARDASLGEQDSQRSADLYFRSSSIPPNARQPWNNALRAMEKTNLALAERELRIVVKEAPKMAEAWNLLGEVTQRLNRPADAAPAFANAAGIDPKLLTARIGLLRANLELKKWQEADAIADALVREGAGDQYPVIHAHRAIARYNLNDLTGAENSARDAIRLDTKRQLPHAEMVLAAVFEARAEYDSAREHMQRYLDLDPRAAGAAEIRDRMNNLGKSATGGPPGPAPVTIEAAIPAADADGEAWVPGGLQALARMAGMRSEPAYHTFFEEYCRAIGREVSVGTAQGIPRFAQGLRVFLANVTELIPLGEKRGDAAILRISAAAGERRELARRILALLGWTLEEREGTVHVEPGYRPEDALLQTVASALGIDQIAMQETLQSGAEFTIEILSENARLVGGDTWNQILVQDAVPPGGLAAVFAADPRLAKTCAGLNAMNTATAGAVLSSLRLRDVAAKHTEAFYRYSATFSVAGGRADVPGGPAADPAWQKLAGANPRNLGEFFRALAEKDTGRLAAFYATLSRADAAHQRYFTASPDRAERFYRWFRDSPELNSGILQHRPGFHTEFLQGAPLEGSGEIHFPGGKAVWFTGAEMPLDNALLQALIPVSRIELNRGAPLDEATARLLARNYARWSALYPYFESLPALGGEDFGALAAFTDALARRSDSERNAVLGEWYALIELIVRGAKAGSLDGAAAARAFRQASLDLSGEAHAAQAVALLQRLTGSGDLEDAVAASLLRLDDNRRARFRRVLELLRAARVMEDAALALPALVYAASLDPGLLILNEDPELLRHHRYWTGGGSPFARAALHGSHDVRGTHFSGGFVGFEEAAKTLMGGAKAAPRVPVSRNAAREARQPLPDSGDGLQADFRSDAKVVEVYTTVTDNRGRYVDDLTLAQFTLLDRKIPQTILAFEPQTSDLSVALLLDTTGSMADTIASLKRAAIKLIDTLRPGDAVAVYSFAEQVTEIAPYTTDRGVTKRAVMNARPFGNTALYDAIAHAGHEMTGRAGKKALIVFTDGRDTASMLTVDAAIERAKVAGVPVYTIAEGEATENPDLLRQLAAISDATGGISFQVRNPDDMAEVFERVAKDLAHGYLLFFQPSSADGQAWHELQVVVGGQRNLRIRAREGYYR